MQDNDLTELKRLEPIDLDEAETFYPPYSPFYDWIRMYNEDPLHNTPLCPAGLKIIDENDQAPVRCVCT